MVKFINCNFLGIKLLELKLFNKIRVKILNLIVLVKRNISIILRIEKYFNIILA